MKFIWEMLDNMNDIMLLSCFVVFGVFIVVIGILNDKKHWNNGNCPICNSPWQVTVFDGKEFVCKNNHRIHLTYRVDT